LHYWCILPLHLTPNEGSVLRLLVPLAVDTNAKWLERKYVSWEDLQQLNEVDEEFTENF
jgi:hypothetical protein